MGTGCQSVKRNVTPDGKIEVVGKWSDGREGIFRESNDSDRKGYGGKAIGERGEAAVGQSEGYDVLLVEIVRMFRTSVVLSIQMKHSNSTPLWKPPTKANGETEPK